MKILAIAEQRDGTLRRVSHEVVTLARRAADALGYTVDAVVLGGTGIADSAADLGRFGADRVLVAEDDAFGAYHPEGYSAALAELIGGGDYYAVFLQATAQGKDYAPRLAARLDQPLATDATAVEVEDGELVVTRPLYAGKVSARVKLSGAPRIVSLRPNAFGSTENIKAGDVERITLSPNPDSWRVKIREFVATAGERPDVGEASVVVSGGRGLGGAEHWGVLEELCDAIGPTCALGASRAVVDAGWRPHGEQVGQTGKVVAPQLYFAVGISGAIQHLAGMRTARTIVAINKDPDAPIFKVADYGIVGDAFEIVPHLAEELRKLREG
jgi:electron transfer flavoprotein alpha subunit